MGGVFWNQRAGVPQGSNLGPGVADLVGNVAEDTSFGRMTQREKEERGRRWVKLRWMDDVFVMVRWNAFTQKSDLASRKFYGDSLNLIEETEAGQSSVVFAGMMIQKTDYGGVTVKKMNPNDDGGVFVLKKRRFQCGLTHDSKRALQNRCYSYILNVVDTTSRNNKHSIPAQLGVLMEELAWLGYTQKTQRDALKRVAARWPDLDVVMLTSTKPSVVVVRATSEAKPVNLRWVLSLKWCHDVTAKAENDVMQVFARVMEEWVWINIVSLMYNLMGSKAHKEATAVWEGLAKMVGFPCHDVLSVMDYQLLYVWLQEGCPDAGALRDVWMSSDGQRMWRKLVALHVISRRGRRKVARRVQYEVQELFTVAMNVHVNGQCDPRICAPCNLRRTVIFLCPCFNADTSCSKVKKWILEHKTAETNDKPDVCPNCEGKPVVFFSVGSVQCATRWRC